MKSIVSRILLIGSFVMITLLCTSITRAQTSINSEKVKNILQDRIDRAKRSVGMVVGIVDDQGTRFICYGKPSLDSDQTVNADTVFEIGSVTKVFTATFYSTPEGECSALIKENEDHLQNNLCLISFALYHWL